MLEDFVIPTPVGHLKIQVESDQLKNIELITDQILSLPQSEFGKKVAGQISNYFENNDYNFDIELQQEGTEHQLKVWKALVEIPRGTVLTYGELAKQIGSSPRAVGNACRRNPIPIVVPCHRVVAVADIGGFAGATKGQLLNIKKTLLRHEGLSFE
jgi:methylated-DNA-[protein]-cysteine S-methyltransferase